MGGPDISLLLSKKVGRKRRKLLRFGGEGMGGETGSFGGEFPEGTGKQKRWFKMRKCLRKNRERRKESEVL